MILQHRNGIPHLCSELLLKYGVPHAFTTRRGGVSRGDFESLNISTRRQDQSGNTDDYLNTVENFSRVLSLVDAMPENSVCAHQVHGNDILELSEKHCGMGILRSAKVNVDGDGLYVSGTDSAIKGICVKSADCTPILFADIKRGSVCAVHSGWRGTVLDIPGEAVRKMILRGSRIEDIICAVGPCIGKCCYEVSEDVFLAAQSTLNSHGKEKDAAAFFINRRDTEQGVKFHFDIGGMCAYLVHLSGVPKENIQCLDVCTCCSCDENGRIFFSHRGQKGHSGTFASVIAPFDVK